MRSPCLAAVLLAVAATATAQDRILSVEEYALELSGLDVALGDHRFDDVLARTASLRATRVAFGEGTTAVDKSLLAAAERAREPKQVETARRRIRALRSALASSDTATASAADRARLARLQADGQVDDIEKGGEVGGPHVKPLTLPEQVLEMLRSVRDWFRRVMRKLRDLLRKLWPKPPPHAAGSLQLNLGVLALVGAVTAVLAVLAYRALRRGRRAPPVPTSARRVSSAADENPLSREAGEWERYAQELAAQGRRREAIRAFYHAVLMALFRAGILHYRKSRTNWEYASELAPELRFRPSFLEITRLFDREWYGHDSSAAEALARCAEEARRILRSAGGAEGVP